MTCPSKLCPRSDRAGCDLLVCAFDLPALRRFQRIGGFSAIERVQPAARTRGRTDDRRGDERSQEWKRLFTEELLTLEDIGERYGVTRERVRQVLKRDWGVGGRDFQTKRTLTRKLAKAKECPNCRKPVLRAGRMCSSECVVTWRTNPDRFWAKADKTSSPDGCWLWTDAPNPVTGYGRMTWGTGYRLAHRLAYELAIGPIPDGLTIDHVKDRGCRNHHCVNPAHLEAVTLRETRDDPTFCSEASIVFWPSVTDATGRVYQWGGARLATCGLVTT